MALPSLSNLETIAESVHDPKRDTSCHLGGQGLVNTVADGGEWRAWKGRERHELKVKSVFN